MHTLNIKLLYADYSNIKFNILKGKKNLSVKNVARDVHVYIKVTIETQVSINLTINHRGSAKK